MSLPYWELVSFKVLIPKISVGGWQSVSVCVHTSVHVHGGVWGGLPSMRQSGLPLPPACPSLVWGMLCYPVAWRDLTWIPLISWAVDT